MQACTGAWRSGRVHERLGQWPGGLARPGALARLLCCAGRRQLAVGLEAYAAWWKTTMQALSRRGSGRFWLPSTCQGLTPRTRLPPPRQTTLPTVGGLDETFLGVEGAAAEAGTEGHCPPLQTMEASSARRRSLRGCGDGWRRRKQAPARRSTGRRLKAARSQVERGSVPMSCRRQQANTMRNACLGRLRRCLWQWPSASPLRRPTAAPCPPFACRLAASRHPAVSLHAQTGAAAEDRAGCRGAWPGGAGCRRQRRCCGGRGCCCSG